MFEDLILAVQDFPKKGVLFRDITPVLENNEAFHECIDRLYEGVKIYRFNKIICADARGFLFGSALAYRCNAGLVLARKLGKLPRPGISSTYSLEYGLDTLEISAGSLNKDDRVLIIDDLLATGGTAHAMENLVEQSSATVVAAAFVIELLELCGRQGLSSPVVSLVKYGCTVGSEVVVDVANLVDDDQLRYCGQFQAKVLKMTDDTITIPWDMEETKDGTLEVPKNLIRQVVLENNKFRYRR